jgi:hypothetical protein
MEVIAGKAAKGMLFCIGGVIFSKLTLLALQDWPYFRLLCASCSYLHVSSLGFIGCL